MSSWNNFAKPTVLKWVMIPTAITFTTFMFSLKKIAPKSYVDVVYLGFTAIPRIFAGFVHAFKSDGGLKSLAQMDETLYKQHEWPLLLGYRAWGQMDLAVGLLKMYTIYYRPEFVQDMVAYDIISKIGIEFATWIGISDEEFNGIAKMVPVAPGRKTALINMMQILIYGACKLVEMKVRG